MSDFIEWNSQQYTKGDRNPHDSDPEGRAEFLCARVGHNNDFPRYLVARKLQYSDSQRVESQCQARSASHPEPHPGMERVERVRGIDSSGQYYLTDFVRWRKDDSVQNEPADWGSKAPNLVEYLERQNLPRLSLPDTWGIISQVAAALDWLADKGGHGDAHEHNILINEDGLVTVVDACDSSRGGVCKDLQMLHDLLLFLLTGIGTNRAANVREKWREYGIRKADQEHVKQALDILRDTVDIKATEERANEDPQPAQALAGQVRGKLSAFLEALVAAPSITPMLFPSSFGFLLTQALLFFVTGMSLLIIGFFGVSPQVRQALGYAQRITPIPIIVPTPYPLPTSTPRSATVLMSAIPTATVVAKPPMASFTPLPVTPISADAPTSTPASPLPQTRLSGVGTETSTVTPVATVKPSLMIAPTATPTFPVSMMPPTCIRNEDALTEQRFGFAFPNSHGSFGAADKIKLIVHEAIHYSIRAMPATALPVTKNVMDWRSILDCTESPLGVRCQQEIPSRKTQTRWDDEEHLLIEWRQGMANTRYGLLLEIERLENGNARTYCAYVFDVLRK